MDEVFIAYSGLLTLATSVIYVGAWGSLPPWRKSTLKQQQEGLEGDEDEDEDEQDLDERLSASDAYLFPIMASFALLGLYLIFKYFGTDWVNWLLGWYFAIMGCGSVWKTSTALLRLIMGREKWRSFDKTKLYMVKDKREVFSLSFRTPTPFILPFSLLPSAIYMLSNDLNKPALITNILGLSFAYNALCLIKLDSFQTATILLGGLFVYDIWWVFGTEVMVKVATTLDAPIKILWPKSGDLSASKGFALLGLGDIVIPGALVTLALRRDLFASPACDPNVPFAKPYFTAALLAYVLGLVSTMAVLHTFRVAQPALLYLSPACILSFVATAIYRGELKEIWLWQDQPEKKMETSEPDELKVREPIAPQNGVAASNLDRSAAESDAGVDVALDGDEGEGTPRKRRSSRKKR